jgi:hypothetical protein
MHTPVIHTTHARTHTHTHIQRYFLRALTYTQSQLPTYVDVWSMNFMFSIFPAPVLMNITNRKLNSQCANTCPEHNMLCAHDQIHACEHCTHSANTNTKHRSHNSTPISKEHALQTCVNTGQVSIKLAIKHVHAELVLPLQRTAQKTDR